MANNQASKQDIDVMNSILQRLNENSNDVAKKIINESKTKPELGVAVETRRTETGVTVSMFEIVTEKVNINEDVNKVFYKIINNKTGKVVVKDLGLFESAMGIIKHLLFTKQKQKAENIIRLDAKYVSNMIETYNHKKRLRDLEENTPDHDVVVAKYTRSREKLFETKRDILKIL